MKTPKMVAVQTSQGTWVRREDGADDPLRHVNVAQVYAPPSEEVPGANLEARFRASEEAMLQTATLLASAPELAAMLRRLCETHWDVAGSGSMSATVIEAEALLAKVGG